MNLKAPSAGENALVLPCAEETAEPVVSVQGRLELALDCRFLGFCQEPLCHQKGGKQYLKDSWMEGLAGYIA